MRINEKAMQYWLTLSTYSCYFADRLHHVRRRDIRLADSLDLQRFHLFDLLADEILPRE